jgi:uroporphyrinogen decarboxylase
LRDAHIPRIHFGTDTYAFLDDFSSVESEVIGVDWRAPLPETRKIIGKKALQGNLDPHIMLADFTYIKKRVDEIFRDVGDRRGFIFNLGHGILPSTPRDNVRKLVEYIHEK